ncbi:hypothetical protein QUB05_05545 [Microcoleus sp. F10-C6]|uniref:hypothetical protein n=1 Tax=unclassified Microcoleus TaxID=2642155 RepID=UPI002FD0126D
MQRLFPATKIIALSLGIHSNDPVALADSIEWSGQNLPQLQSMGKASLQQAHSMTHQEMHRSRWQLLLKMLQSSKV